MSKTVHVAAVVPIGLAKSMRELAKRNERTVSAEIRLALRAWVDADDDKRAA